MSLPKSPLARLDRQELLWLAGILEDACHERLEKNLVNQALENRLYERGPVEGRLDPRPFLRIWEPRYRKFLKVASDLRALLEGEDAQALARSLGARVATRRRNAIIEKNGAGSEGNDARPRRKSGS